MRLLPGCVVPLRPLVLLLLLGWRCCKFPFCVCGLCVRVRVFEFLLLVASIVVFLSWGRSQRQALLSSIRCVALGYFVHLQTVSMCISRI